MVEVAELSGEARAALHLLTKRAIQDYLYGRETTVSMRSFVSDGRKRKKVVRELIEADLVVQKNLDDPDWNDNVIPTDKVWELITPEDINLCSAWDEQHGNEHSTSQLRNMPFVPLDTQFTAGQKKTLIESDEVDWYVAQNSPLQYHCRWTDEPNVDDSTHYKWYGPFDTLAEAQEAVAEKNAIVARASHDSMQIFVSSPELRVHMDKRMFDEELTGLRKINLAWGLTHFKILSDNESKIIDCNQSSGLGRRSSASVGPDPDKWEENTDKVIDQSRQELHRIQERIRIMEKVQQGIREFGGWEAFLGKYTAELRSQMIAARERKKRIEDI